MLSLIDAITGVPDRLFPTDGSEVVAYFAGVRNPFTIADLSLRILQSRHIFIKAFNNRNISQLFAAVNRRMNKNLAFLEICKTNCTALR